MRGSDLLDAGSSSLASSAMVVCTISASHGFGRSALVCACAIAAAATFSVDDLAPCCTRSSRYVTTCSEETGSELNPDATHHDTKDCHW